MLCGSWAEAAVSFAVGGGLISDSVREIEVDAAELLAPRLGLLPLRSFGGGVSCSTSCCSRSRLSWQGHKRGRKEEDKGCVLIQNFLIKLLTFPSY